MDKKVEEVLESLFSKESYERPCDTVEPENLEMKLPVWFDEKKFNQGRRFQKDFFFMQTISMMLGLIAVMAIPSILSVLVGSRRSNSEYTAFKRYWSTFNHVSSWYSYDLKPGSVSWRSLETVRKRHILADRASKLKGHGTVSQRDVAFTLFGFISFTILSPDKLAIRALRAGDWEAFNHFWAVVTSMIGLEDRYNICRKNYHETRQICRVIRDKVFTPCLTNTPNYFEHAVHVMTCGMSAVHPAIEHGSLVYLTKYLSKVPGYIYTEEERLKLEEKLTQNASNVGVVSTALTEKCPIDFQQNTVSEVLHVKDYETLDSSPPYRRLPLKAKFIMTVLEIIISLYATNVGRIIFNLHFQWYVFLGTYLPYVAMWRYGLRKAYNISLFQESPTDDFEPLPNSKYFNREPKTWVRELWDCIF